MSREYFESRKNWNEPDHGYPGIHHSSPEKETISDSVSSVVAAKNFTREKW